MTLQKGYNIKIYDLLGNFVKVLQGQYIMSDIHFSSQINGGQWELAVTLNVALDSTIVEYNNIVKVYETDSNNSSGILIYTGVITSINRYKVKSGDYVEMRALGLATMLTWFYYNEASSYSFSKNQELSETIKDIVDAFSVDYPAIITYDSESVEDTDITGNQAFDYTYLMDAVNKVKASATYWWHVDNSGKMLYKPKMGTDSITNIGVDKTSLDMLYTLDNDVLDYSGNGRNGSISGNVTYDHDDLWGFVNFNGDRNYGAWPTGTPANVNVGNVKQYTHATSYSWAVTFSVLSLPPNNGAGIFWCWFDNSVYVTSPSWPMSVSLRGSTNVFVGIGSNFWLTRLGQIHTVSFTYDASTLKAYVYLDGVLQNPGGTTAPTTFTTNDGWGIWDNAIGGGNGSSCWKNVYAATVIGRALTAEEHMEITRFQQGKAGQVRHVFTSGVDIDSIKIEENSEEVVNRYILTWDAGTVTAEDAASQALYWIRELHETKTEILDVGTANSTAAAYIAEYKDAKRKTTIVVNSEYNIETIQPWDLVSVGNLDYEISVLQIQKIEYNSEKITIELEQLTSLAQEIALT